jgi:hypothetical protein
VSARGEIVGWRQDWEKEEDLSGKEDSSASCGESNSTFSMTSLRRQSASFKVEESIFLSQAQTKAIFLFDRFLIFGPKRFFLNLCSSFQHLSIV